MKNIKFITSYFLILIFIISCNNDESVEDKEAGNVLKLSINWVNILVNETKIINIEDGSGAYAISVDVPSIADISIDGNNFTIRGKKSGKAVITVKDKSSNKIGKIELNVFKTDLVVSEKMLSMKQGEMVAVTIKKGTGSYDILNSNSSVINTTLNGTTISIKAIAVGNAKIEVVDLISKEIEVIKVEVDVETDIAKLKVLVKGGVFVMGDNKGLAPESPEHQVTLADFHITKYEVTNAQFAEFLSENGNKTEGGTTWLNTADDYCQLEEVSSGVWQSKTGKKNYPVMNITWYAARAYCLWVGGSLPTEAQWEYAARGGVSSKSYLYSGSNTLDEVAWFFDNSDNSDNNFYNEGKGSHKVGKKQPNELGLYDMSGNVWEFCNDFYDENYYQPSPVSNPIGPVTGDQYVIRGGDFFGNGVVDNNDFRTTSRNGLAPDFSSIIYGFRVVFN